MTTLSKNKGHKGETEMIITANTQNNIVSIANENIPYAVAGTEYTFQLSGALEGTTYALVGQYEDVIELTPTGLLRAKFESEGIMPVRFAVSIGGNTQEMDLEFPVYAVDEGDYDEDDDD